MKCAGLFLIFLLSVSGTALTQIEMEFEDKGDLVDLGDIEKTGGDGRYELVFKNTGRTPLIIQRASTSDGGTMAEYPKEPIPPGKKGKISFIYIKNHPGPHSRALTISASGETGNFTKVITVKYRIIYPPTTISIEPAILETRALPFGEADTLTFTVTNTGTVALYLDNSFYDNVNKDIIVQKIHKKGGKEDPSSYQLVACETGQQMEVTLVVLNLYGRTSPVKHQLTISYNIGQSFSVPLTINGTSSSPTEKRIEHNRILYFTNGELNHIDEFSSRGTVNSAYYFEKGSCTKRIHYDSRYTITVLYKDEKEISRTTVSLEEKQ